MKLDHVIDAELPYYSALENLIMGNMLAMSRKEWNSKSKFVFVSSTELIGDFLMKREGNLNYDVYIPTNKDQFATDWFVAKMVEDDL